MCLIMGAVYLKHFTAYRVLYVYGYTCIGKDIDIHLGFF